LAVFAGGRTVAASAAVLGRDEGETLAVVQRLAAHSLVRASPDRDHRRFTMLETIREFGMARLAETGEEHQARDRHAPYFRHLAEQAAPDVTEGFGGWLGTGDLFNRAERRPKRAHRHRRDCS
jgi:predicted ATPase